MALENRGLYSNSGLNSLFLNFLRLNSKSVIVYHQHKFCVNVENMIWNIIYVLLRVKIKKNNYKKIYAPRQ